MNTAAFNTRAWNAAPQAQTVYTGPTSFASTLAGSGPASSAAQVVPALSSTPGRSLFASSLTQSGPGPGQARLTPA